jgi:FeS assembly SUF system regulator
MLRIGKLTDYAFVVLQRLAQTPDQALSAHAIASLTALPEPTVSKVLKIMTRAGLITSIRGAGGGYHLQKPAEDISILHIIEVMEGRVMMVECVETDHNCTIGQNCPLQGRWDPINAVLRDTLSTWSLTDLNADAGQYNFIKEVRA